MNGQKKGGCGHFMAEWDQHVSCPACRDCVFPDRPCPVCLAFSPEQRELASSARRLRLQRQKRKAAKASSRSGSVSGTAGSWEGDGLGLPRLTSFPTVAGQGGEEESVESGPLPIDESLASPRPTRPRVESRETLVGRHSSPDSVAGQEEAALPECRSRPRSRHARSTGDRRSSVDRRAAGLPVARSTGERRSSGDRRATGRPALGPAPALPTPGRPACVRRPVDRAPVDRRSVTTSQLSSGRPVTALIRLGMFHVPDCWRTGLVGVTLLNLYQTSWVSVVASAS